MTTIKVLIITYYWPPGGGAGVQRWVKLTKYLDRYKITPYVLTVDENYASYMQIDKSLEKDISPQIKIHKTKSFEPINYYAKIFGKKNVPVAGFSNVNNNNIRQKIMNSIRSNFFIPDPRKGWNRYAYRKAAEIIKSENIKLVITSSPPHSSQLIGLKLQKKLNVKWIADLRDPWTDIYYYKSLGHSFLSRLIDQHFERKVLINADKIITVSSQLKALFGSKDHKIDSSRLYVIPNGYDKADFDNVEKAENKAFTICYTGTMADTYDPSTFFHALKQVVDLHPGSAIKLQIVGQVSDLIKKQITEIGLSAAFIPTVTHREVIEYQKNADMLLLIIPNVQNSEGILTGKLFEYLASGNTIICIGPELGDAARIIETCETGKTFGRDKKQAIVKYIESALHCFLKKKKNTVNWEEIESFSREKQAGMVRKIADRLLN